MANVNKIQIGNTTYKITDSNAFHKGDIADYIVERGTYTTSDNYASWRWEKWNSGTLKVWGRRRFSGYNRNTTTGVTGLYSTNNISFSGYGYPVTFVASPYTIVSYTATSGYGGWIEEAPVTSGVDTVSAPPPVRLLGFSAITDGTLAGAIDINAVGRWK